MCWQGSMVAAAFGLVDYSGLAVRHPIWRIYWLWRYDAVLVGEYDVARREKLVSCSWWTVYEVCEVAKSQSLELSFSPQRPCSLLQTRVYLRTVSLTLQSKTHTSSMSDPKAPKAAALSTAVVIITVPSGI
jgi:hypothetical protein